MKHSSGSRSCLFLMEMIVAILFFSLVSAVCLQVFTKAHLLSEDASDLSAAVIQTESAAELLKHSESSGNDSFARLLKNEYPDSVKEEDIYSVYFDENWDDCEAGEGVYIMKIHPVKEEDFTSCEIRTYHMKDTAADRTDSGADNALIYDISFKLHAAETIN